MTLFRSRSSGPISSWIERSNYRGKLTPHVTFDSTGPETWSIVSCGLVVILVCQGVSSARYQTGPRAKLESHRADGA